MESKRARKPPDRFDLSEGGAKQTKQTLRIEKFMNDMDSKRLKKPPLWFVPCKEGVSMPPRL